MNWSASSIIHDLKSKEEMIAFVNELFVSYVISRPSFWQHIYKNPLSPFNIPEKYDWEFISTTKYILNRRVMNGLRQ